MQRISSLGPSIVKTWAPRVALAMSILFLGIGAVFSYIAGEIVYVPFFVAVFFLAARFAFRKTFSAILDGVWDNGTGLFFRHGSTRGYIPLSRITDVTYEPGRTRRSSLGNLPLVRLTLDGDGKLDSEVQFVPVIGFALLNQNAMEAKHQNLVDDLLRRAETDGS